MLKQRVTCQVKFSRGPESVPESRTISVDGPLEVSFAVRARPRRRVTRPQRSPQQIDFA
jgi:hypothetical protein